MKTKKPDYSGPQRRKFIRLDYFSPLAYKVCKRKTISKLLCGYTCDISEAGLLCKLKNRVQKNDILWLSFDRSMLSICKNVERKSLVYQNGIIGKVVRTKHNAEEDGYDIGIRFLTRQEKNITHIYPKIHFIKEACGINDDNGQEEEAQDIQSGDV